MNRIKLNIDDKIINKIDKTKNVLEYIKKYPKLYKCVKMYLPIELIYFIYYKTVSNDIYDNYKYNCSSYINDIRSYDNTIANYLVCSVYEYLLMGHLTYMNNEACIGRISKIGEGNIDITRNALKISNEPDISYYENLYEVQVNFYDDTCCIKKSKLDTMIKEYGKDITLVQFYKSSNGLNFKYINVMDIIENSSVRVFEGYGNKECYIMDISKYDEFGLLDTVIKYI